MKKCSKCKKDRELSQFKKDITKKDGLYSSCKICVSEYRVNHYQENKEFYKNKNHLYYEENSDKVKKKVKEYIYNRKEIDPLFKLKCKLRTKTYQAFKKKSWTKNSSNLEMLGCDFESAKSHIESLFKKNMSWSNYGEWHIDHIIPLSSAKNENELKRLFHYTNLQPLWASENWIKSNKIL